MTGSALEVYADLLEEDMRIELGVTLGSQSGSSRPATATDRQQPAQSVLRPSFHMQQTQPQIQTPGSAGSG